MGVWMGKISELRELPSSNWTVWHGRYFCTCCLPNYLLSWVIFHGELLNYRSTLILFERMTTWCLDTLAMIINRTCCDAVQFQPESLLLIQALNFLGESSFFHVSHHFVGDVSEIAQVGFYLVKWAAVLGRTPFVNKNYFLFKTMYGHPVWTR